MIFSTFCSRNFVNFCVDGHVQGAFTCKQNEKRLVAKEHIFQINSLSRVLSPNRDDVNGRFSFCTLTERSKDLVSTQTQSGLECRRCLTHLALGTTREKTHNDSEDNTKTKESLCGLLFNCYVLCLFVLGSYIPMD